MPDDTRWSRFVRAVARQIAEPSASLAIAVAGALGAYVAILTFGLGYLSGSSEFWSYPVGDAGMMMNGWRYLLADSWHWPLLHTRMTNTPWGVNILYLDSIPLVALISKLAHSLLGVARNPYGPWHLIIYVLQGVFAALLARRLQLRSLLASTGMALLCLSMNAFVMRFYHEGLNGHFVLLWALLAYLRTNGARRWTSLTLEWTAVLVVAVLMHPYLFVMVLPFFGAATARLARGHRRTAALLACSSVALVSSVLVVCGYLPSRLPSDPGLFGAASLNLMSLGVPFLSALSPWLPPQGMQSVTPAQSDGANFLGIGVIGLLLMTAVLTPRAFASGLRRHAFLAAGLAILALYAPSNRWFLGPKLLFEYRIPGWIAPVAGNLRATGRFFWPVSYVLLVGAALVCARRVGPRYGGLLLFGVGLLQMVDVGPFRTIVAINVSRPWTRRLDWNDWTAALARGDEVDSFPSYMCWGAAPFTEDLLMRQREIEFIAARDGKRTNGGRTARPIRDCAPEYAEEGALLAGTAPRAPHRIDVFMRAAFAADVLQSLEQRYDCRALPDALVCSE